VLNPSIFKAYDIRGLYPSEIDEDGAFHIGQALVDFTGAKNVLVGRDMRTSSLALSNALIAGITKARANVFDVGLVSTPELYFAVSRTESDAAVVVTASHNPQPWNGFKMYGATLTPIGKGCGMEEISYLSQSSSFLKSPQEGKRENLDLSLDYARYLSSFAKFGNKKFKIVVDCANAMGAREVPALKKLPNVTLDILFGELDGTFPNHEANPIKIETLKVLRNRVRETGADVGIAYDGDADRLGVVDENGDPVPADIVTAIVARALLRENKEGVILYDLRSSRVVKETILKAGGVAIECRVGHAYIKKEMRELEAIFAGELVGHFYFNDMYPAESSTRAAILLLNEIARTGKKCSELVVELSVYAKSEEMNFAVVDKEELLAKLKEVYKDGEQSELDGLKVAYPDWWFSIRASNTESLVRLNVEAIDQSLLKQKIDELVKQIGNR